MQLLTAVVPTLGKLSREEGGRQKISLYTRVLTIALCVFQGWMLAKSLVTPEANPFLRDIASEFPILEKGEGGPNRQRSVLADERFEAGLLPREPALD